MPRAGISYNEVAAAADALTAEGLLPSLKALRERIGTGSPNTIHRHVTAWRAARAPAPAVAPGLPPQLLTAIAGEIGQQTARARADVEALLVEVQAEAVELAKAGEALEDERDGLAERVAALTRERDTVAGKALEQASEIERQAQEIERERNAAEQARIEVAQQRHRMEAQAESVATQAAEIERLRAALAEDNKGRVVAEQNAAVLTAKLEAAEARATKAEARADQAERQSRADSEALVTANLALQTAQAHLQNATRERDTTREQIEAVRKEAKQSGETAAELRGQLAAMTPAEPIAPPPKAGK